MSKKSGSKKRKRKKHDNLFMDRAFREGLEFCMRDKCWVAVGNMLNIASEANGVKVFEDPLFREGFVSCMRETYWGEVDSILRTVLEANNVKVDTMWGVTKTHYRQSKLDHIHNVFHVAVQLGDLGI